MMNDQLLKHIGSMLVLCSLTTSARAASTDIATAPLVTSATMTVKPNLLFVLDDSGSMDWDYLPDWANDNFCRNTSGGAFTGACCRNSSGSSTSNSCWTGSAPFGSYRGHPPYLSGSFNGVYYNPAITYTPPLNADGSSKASQTSWTSVKDDAYNIQSTTSTNLTTQFPDMEWCTDTSYSDCLRNDNYILPATVNGKNYTTFHATTGSSSGSVATGSPSAPTTTARSFGPHYYTMLPGEYCDSPNLRNCQLTQTAVFQYPSVLRWCSSTSTASTVAATLCQAAKTSTYKYPRYPTTFYTAATAGTPATAAVPARATFSIALSGCSSSKKVAVQSVTANGVNLLSSATSLQSSASSLASAIASRITVASYTATSSGSSVTISAPVASGNISYAITLARASGSHAACTYSLTPATPSFSGYVAAAPAVPATLAGYYGSFVRVDIVPSINSYAYPGTSTKASTRTDCAGATCTYAEEMTNFANWWTYYHTRMQMMKSSASITFGALDTRYRVGYLSINNNTSRDFLNMNTFDSSQKTSWYSKLTSAIPSNSTPLRTALTKAGRFYAGKLNATTLNGSTVVDPMQYSCQQNFTIFSTDGYWNESSPGGYQLDGSTAIGNQDGSLTRPQQDGNNTSNTLSDVAAYYYATDLRAAGGTTCTGTPVAPATTGNDVCTNNVPTSGQDAAAHQHMTTFTVGLGATGTMQFSSSYPTATSGDYFDVKNGTTANPSAGICSWQTSGTTCNWPIPVSDTQTTIDDLWHAAVNGYGTYFSAGNPSALSTGLSNALAGVSARTGDSAAATTSNPNVATGDNFLFSSTFTSVEWTGELNRQQIDLTTGAVSSVKDWSAQALLDTNSSRQIYTYDPATANRMKDFTWAGLTSAEKNFFNTPAISTLSQFCTTGVTCLSAASQTAAAGANLVAFLIGDRSNEGSATDISKYYRQRTHVLGDIVSSEVAYVKAPLYNYADTGYDSFKSANTSREGMAYVAGNDGMLHAFNSTTGQESWAYVPSLVLPTLYKLADKNYSSLHQFTVDGTPTSGDIYASGDWHTILVGGLNAGGRGYYALDVTDPAAPKALWEFTYDTSKGSGYLTDANLGYTFGKPEITKLKDGTWVVLVTSGYNNVSPGDGQGYLYVINAYTGALIRKISTGVGSATSTVAGVCTAPPCPSGLAQIRAWADNNMNNNTATRVYGGDLYGNLWRFDINNDIGAAGYDAQLLATLRGSSSNAQPITAKPELGDVSGVAVVYVGTGRYMGVSDLTDTQPQTLYAIKDTLGTTSLGNPRSAGSNFIQQTLTATTCTASLSSTLCSSTGQSIRTVTAQTVDFSLNNGWYVDLLDSGERANTDPQLALGTLAYTTNVPDSSACTVGGYSYIYYFDYRTGSSVSTATANVSGVKLGNSLATRPVFARLPNNKVVDIIRLSDGSTIVSNVPIGNAASSTRRVSWREIIAE